MGVIEQIWDVLNRLCLSQNVIISKVQKIADALGISDFSGLVFKP